MTQSIAPKDANKAIGSPPSSEQSIQSAERGERRLREGGGWLMLYFLLQAELGLAWDRNWHDFIGRDQFWIPPHILIYSGIGVAGLIALIVVLMETLRYRRHVPGVDDASTVQVLRYFHAPLGYMLLGFGALTDLCAAPFDNYWHELYGIDVTLWSPFHLMGTFGGIMIGFGIIYLFASEATYARKIENRARLLGLTSAEWGMLIFFAAFLEFGLPALTAFTAIPLGPWQLPTYPIPLTIGSVVLFIAAIQVTRRVGAATIMACLLVLLSLMTQSFVPFALNIAVTHFGAVFRASVGVPVFNITLVLIAVLLCACALMLDGAAYWQFQHNAKRMMEEGIQNAWVFGVGVALLLLFVPALIIQTIIHLFPMLPFPKDILLVITPDWSSMLLVLPVMVVIGLGSTWLGFTFGDIWRWNER